MGPMSVALKAASFVAPPLFVSVFLAMVGGAFADRFDLNDAYNSCLDAPDYALGGAMAGDCMIDRSAEIDQQINTALAQAAKKFCRSADREAIKASQAAWLNYRDSYCTLIQNSPGNTGAWINGGACYLDLTQKRLESLIFLTDHAYAWCRGMQLLETLSHFGDPGGVVRRDEEAGIAWSVREVAGKRFLEVSASQTSLEPALDITSCRYCSSGADCSDGVFLFSSEDDAGNLSHRVAHLCTLEASGPRLDMIELVPSEAPSRTTLDAKRQNEWMIEGGGLRIVVDGNDNSQYWPEARRH